MQAIYDWIVDNDATPHVLIFADNPQVIVPHQFIEDGKIILNISPTAAQNILIDKDGLSFSARFGGKPFNIYAPIGAVLALYASENGEGLSFEAEDSDETPPDAPSNLTKPTSVKTTKTKKSPNKKKSKPPTLKVVK